ncbi:N-formylglutamate amidohydrolase [Actinoplanes sp. NPDC051851]|uniref:N-formylglutamate amidohydrolase n=1 Tax=Actinoplanes sp. NPDC051851 TaxID=3154753 RepID=UPI003448A530
MILHVPHASRALRGSFLASPAEIGEELDHLTDAHTDVIASLAAEMSEESPWIFRNLWSRLVVDPERFPDESEEMLRAGMGPVYTHGFAGRRLRDPAPALLHEHFLPYAESFTAAVDERLAAAGRVVILDVHSYSTEPLPYELHADGPRPPVCLGTDDFHTPPALLGAARAAFEGTALNSPFAGCYVPRKHYHRDPRVTALMLEIRRDQYMHEPGGEPHDGLDRIAAALASLIASLP